MNDIQNRIGEAESLWVQGDRAFAAGNLADAWRCYNEAHDRVTDCPELHRRAHARLQTVNRLNGHRGEYRTDTVLLALAPLGVFRLLALLLHLRIASAADCQRVGRAHS